MFELMHALGVLGVFDLKVTVAGGELRLHDAAKMLLLMKQQKEFVVVVRKGSGLTLVMDKPNGAGDWEQPVVDCQHGYTQHAESYAEHYLRVVGGPPDHVCLEWKPGAALPIERDPTELVLEAW